jgi:nitrogen regulatory protein PII
MKRLDLIVSERELERICTALIEAGAPGYTVLRHVTGRGHGGTVSEGMEFSGFGANSHVIVFCETECLEAVRTALRPLLAYYGGVGFVADAQAL